MELVNNPENYGQFTSVRNLTCSTHVPARITSGSKDLRFRRYISVV
uniref:Uncharacterized protein n=1 Tax=Rhizophora mucronata TaxID=61149 RepID=A0A2P2NR61_RHIMU